MLTDKEKIALVEVANAIKANPQHLYALINFESRWNPKAKNPTSSARGLIQFMDATAREMGYKSSLDLVEKFPDIESQLKGPVKKYLMRYAPYPTDQELFMAVFYPKARFWPPLKAFPDSVQNANKGIKTVRDYVSWVYTKLNNADLVYQSLKDVQIAGKFPVWLVASSIGAMTFFLMKFLK